MRAYSCQFANQEQDLPPLQHTESLTNFVEVDPETILAYLTERQHVRPHGTVQQALEGAMKRYSCCPQAVERAMQWLGIDSTHPIGRLRRGQIIQLARAVHRFWMQNAAAANAAR